MEQLCKIIGAYGTNGQLCHWRQWRSLAPMSAIQMAPLAIVTVAHNGVGANEICWAPMAPSPMALLEWRQGSHWCKRWRQWRHPIGANWMAPMTANGANHWHQRTTLSLAPSFAPMTANSTIQMALTDLSTNSAIRAPRYSNTLETGLLQPSLLQSSDYCRVYCVVNFLPTVLEFRLLHEYCRILKF